MGEAPAKRNVSLDHCRGEKGGSRAWPDLPKRSPPEPDGGSARPEAFNNLARAISPIRAENTLRRRAPLPPAGHEGSMPAVTRVVGLVARNQMSNQR